MTDCECDNVTNYEGKHQCILCGRRFMPVEVCGKCDESKPEPQNKVSAFREGLKNAGDFTVDRWIQASFKDSWDKYMERCYTTTGLYKPKW